MLRRGYKGTSLLLAFVLLLTNLVPLYQQFPPVTYAAEREVAPCMVEFEHPQYYAVRSDDYVYIPVVLSGEVVSGSVVWVDYVTGDGTAVAEVDYQPASGTLSISTTDNARHYSFIKIKLMKSSVTEDRTFQLTLSNSQAAVLGDKSQTVVNIRSSGDYVAVVDWEELYNGWNRESTGIEKWDGIYPNDSWGAREYDYSRFKTIGVTYSMGIQAQKAYRMSNLEFRWKNVRGGSKVLLSRQPGTVTDRYDTLPPYDSWFAQTGSSELMYDFEIGSLSAENSTSKLYVGFYADSKAVFELLSARIQKKQYDFHVSIPEGSALEVAGKRYESSFTGRFTYDGPEKLKAVAPVGHSFSGWDYYLPSGVTVKLSAAAEVSINDLVTAMVHNFDLYEAQNLGVQLRPVFTRNTYPITVSSTSGGTASGGGSYRYGSVVTLTATPAEGHAFSHWSSTGAPDVHDNPWRFYAGEPLTVTANFVRGYVITAEASPPEGGTAVIEGTAIENAPITARATANPGYRFVNWTENDSGGTVVSASADYAFNATADLRLVANFEPVQSEITVGAYPTSGGKVTGTGLYFYGGAITLSAVPYGDYEFVNWTESGLVVSSDAVYTFVLNKDGDRTFTANFSLKPGNFSMTPFRQFVGELVTFDASRIFHGNDGIAFSWQFGDGAVASGAVVSHSYTDPGTYDVTVSSRRSGELVSKTRKVTIVEPLPLEQSDFRVEPRGISLVEPGRKTSWTLAFTNNGVPMANKSISVSDELLAGIVNITTDASGEAAYETTVPASQSQYELYVVTFSHATLTTSRGLQVYSTNITLTGQVFDSYSGRRLEGALVSAGGKTALTDSEGMYAIAGLSSSAGKFVLVVTLDGYQVANREIDLISSESVCNIPLVRYIPGTLPVIGWVYSERSDSVSSLSRFFPYGESLPLQINVTIDWRGHEPGTVDFILPDKTLEGSLEGSGGYTASRVIDVGSEIAPGGRLYVQVVTETGVKSAPVDAMIEVMPPSPLDSGMKVLDIPNVKEPLLIAPGLPFVSGMSVSTNLPGLKVEVEIKDDGTANMYMGLVCARKDADPTDFMSNLVGPDQFKEVKKLYQQLQKGKSTVNTGVDFDVVLGGKYVFVYDQNKKQWNFTEGWLVISGSGEVTTTAYAMTPILVPVYIQASVGGALTVHIGFTLDDQYLMSMNATMTPEMWVRVAAGVGLAGMISAEIFGKVHGQFTIILSEGEFDKWLVGVTCGIRLVFFMFAYEKTATHRWSSEPAPQFVMSLPDMGELKPLSRDYLARPSVWLPPEQLRVMTTGYGPTDIRDLAETVIQDNVFPYSEPRLIMTHDGPMLVWVADNPLRSDENRTELQYSVFNGTIWSTPRAIDDDGTADFYPQVAPAIGWKGNQKDKTAAAAWINMTTELGSDVGLGDLLSESQISVTFYDRATGNWTDIQGFSSDDFQDTSPQVGASDDSALVVWIRSGAPSSATGFDPQQDTNVFSALYPQQSDIVFSEWNGRAWSEPSIAAKGAGSVIKSSLAYDGNNALFAYTVDTDGDMGTVDDQELFYTLYERGSWSLPVRVTNNDAQDTNPQAVFLGGVPLLFWYQDGRVLYLKGLDATPAMAVDKFGDGLADFTLAIGQKNSLALVWGDGVDAAQEIFSAVYDAAFDSWSQPIQLTHTGDINRSISAVLDGEGNILAVYNRVAADILDDTLVTGQTDLVFTKLTVGRDLAIAEITMSEENPVPGSHVTVSALVVNRGELAEQNVEIAFYEGDPLRGGKQIGRTQVVEGILAAGEARVISIQWTVPKKFEACDLYVVVDPHNKVVDRNRSNNTDFISTMKTDLVIKEMQTQPVGFGQYFITATVANRGSVAAENTKISLYKTQPGQFGPIRGELVETRTLGELRPGQQKDETFNWSYTDGDFENGYTFLYLEATATNENVLGGGNATRIMVRKPFIRGGPVQAFSLDRNVLNLTVGAQHQLQGIFDPPDASLRAIEWQSDNEAVAQVDSDGKVTAIAEGSAVITATSLDGGFTDTCAVTVVDAQKGPSTYKISFDLAGKTFIAGSNSGTVVPVVMEPEMVGDMGYERVRYKVSVSGPGTAQLLAEDSAGQVHDVVSTGYWGPEAGFAVSRDYCSTTEFTARFSEPGDYIVTFSLVDLNNDKAVITQGTAVIPVTAEYVEASLRLMPKTLNTKNPVQGVTGRLTLPAGYDYREIEANSIRLQYGGKSIIPEQVELAGNGLLIKFDGPGVAGLVSAFGTFTLSLTCRTRTQFFRAGDTVTFFSPPASEVSRELWLLAGMDIHLSR